MSAGPEADDKGLQRQFGADEKQQHQHTHFSERCDIVIGGDQPKTGWSHDHTSEDETNQRRLLQAHETEPDYNRNHNYDCDLD